MRKRETIIRRYKLQCVGSGYTLSVPKDWFRAHDIDPDKIEDLLVVANRDIRIVNPKYEDDVHQEGHRIADKAPRPRRRK